MLLIQKSITHGRKDEHNYLDLLFFPDHIIKRRRKKIVVNKRSYSSHNTSPLLVLESVESQHYLGTALLNYLDSSDYCLACRVMQNIISLAGQKWGSKSKRSKRTIIEVAGQRQNEGVEGRGLDCNQFQKQQTIVDRQNGCLGGRGRMGGI